MNGRERSLTNGLRNVLMIPKISATRRMVTMVLPALPSSPRWIPGTMAAAR